MSSALSLTIRLQIPFGFSELEKEFGKHNFNDACTCHLPVRVEKVD
jgi:hypothetical protein